MSENESKRLDLEQQRLSFSKKSLNRRCHKIWTSTNLSRMENIYLSIYIDWLLARLLLYASIINLAFSIYQPCKHIFFHVSMTLYTSWVYSILLSHHCYLFYDIHVFHKFLWNDLYVYKFVRLYYIHGLIGIWHGLIWRVSFRNVWNGLNK